MLTKHGFCSALEGSKGDRVMDNWYEAYLALQNFTSALLSHSLNIKWEFLHLESMCNLVWANSAGSGTGMRGYGVIECKKKTQFLKNLDIYLFENQS